MPDSLLIDQEAFLFGRCLVAVSPEQRGEYMKKIVTLILFLLAILSACAAPAEPVTLRLMTHDSFDISAETMARFTEESGIAVDVFRAGDAGTIVNLAALAADDPLADVIFGVDNTFLSRALQEDIFLPYEEPPPLRDHPR